jgi:hypothetical protein
MITQIKLLLFLFCLNIVSYVVLSATTSGGGYFVAGVNYTHPLNATGNLTQFQEGFNTSGIIDVWQGQGRQAGFLGTIGDFFYGVTSFFNSVRFLVDGFGMTLDWCGSMIPVAQTAFTWIRYILTGVWAMVMFTLAVELISGRQLLD